MHEVSELEVVEQPYEAEQRIHAAQRREATAKRVAEEAMKMLTSEQLGRLRRRLDALEVGDGGEHDERDPGGPG